MKKFKILKVVGLFLSLLVLTVLIVGCEEDPLIPVISKYTIDARVNGIGGTLSLPGKTDVLAGGNLTISFISDKDYEVDVVKVDNTPITTPANLSYSFINVKANHTLEVTFKKIIKKFIVDISVNTGGSASPLGTKEVTEGDNLDITFNPNMGYKASSVMVNDVSYPLTSNVYPLKNISADTKVKGVFEMSDTLRLFTQEKWKLDSLLMREANGTWSRHKIWGVPKEHQQVLTLLPDGTFTVDTDGIPGDGPWSFDNTKKPPLFHMGMTQSVPEGAVSEIEKLDEKTLILSSYIVPSVDPNDTTLSASKVIFTHLNE